ncbi:hypothetical protein FRB95_005713 [Tulasnella sp. JGI-2019a]|nr:hypothetical protein FRB95_005713 [Tulasnella sp. JGI-2019a]
MSEPLLPDNLDRELNDITSLRYRYAIARALYRGQEWRPDQPRRPSLPSELVLYIFRLSGRPLRHPSSAPSPEKTTPEAEKWTDVTISAWGEMLRDQLWCATPPLSARCLEQIRTFRLRTLSCDQKWFRGHEKESYSWFEIGILQRRATSWAPALFLGEAKQTKRSDAWVLTREDSGGNAELNASTGIPLRWRSHTNEYTRLEFKLHVGDIFGRDHEIWEHLRPGDRLGVWMNAQNSGWSCSGKYAEIEVWERWEPSWM